MTQIQPEAGSSSNYSVPDQSRYVFEEGILNNPLIAKNLPKNVLDLAQNIKFEGDDAPSIPINVRFAESVSALKALEAVMINALVKQKYETDIKRTIINTDHAQLFIMSTLIWALNPDGENVSLLQPGSSLKIEKYFPSYDIHRMQATPHRASCTNIYKTKDGRYFHLHGSMNPDPSLESIGLPPEMDAATPENAWKPFMEKMSQIDSGDMQRLASDVYKQAGTICWTADEYKKSEHGKSNANTGLFEIKEHPKPNQKPSWWPDVAQTSSARPLAGLKVVDLTRVIAGPAITRGLAELGASVMRVTAPHLADYSALHCDLNWGKWNSFLDFRKEEDRAAMRKLISEADIVVSGYRPHVLDKWGFGEEDIIELCKDRERGIIYARENCYGWQGSWAERSGWQQISDACCGVSMEYGRAMGNDEPVTPVFPNSDYCTGISGVCGVLQALMLRAEKGGSYTVDLALNYYSQWLVNSCGFYKEEIWERLWAQHDKPMFRHYHNMNYTVPKMLKTLFAKRAGILFRPEFFEIREYKHRDAKIKTVKPVLRFPNNEVTLGYNIGTRSNGVDAPRWPKDLMVEVVSSSTSL